MTVRRIGFILGLILFVLVAALPPFQFFIDAAAAHGTGEDALQLASSMQIVLALVLVMVVWWLTEAVPLPATALLPAVILPLFHVSGIQEEKVFQFTARAVLVD